MRERATVDAIEHVYRRRAGDFFRFAYARLGDQALAQDAVQEGFARALRSRATFRGQGDLEAWIARCVINAAADARSSAGDVAVADPPAAVDDAPDRADFGEEVREAIRRLPPRQRDALFLRFYLDLDYRAIARALEIEVGTVSATLSVARSALGRLLEEVA